MADRTIPSLAAATNSAGGAMRLKATLDKEGKIAVILSWDVIEVALKAYRAAKAQFMISDEDAAKMIAQAVADKLRS